MPIVFPRKFIHGQRVGNADVYGELFIWPGGYFHYMVHTRGQDPRAGSGVNVSLVLFDNGRRPLGTYGMAPEQEWRVGPATAGLSGQRFDELYGKIPAEKLAQTEYVTLAFRSKDQKPDPDALAAAAGTGSELDFCPSPD